MSLAAARHSVVARRAGGQTGRSPAEGKEEHAEQQAQNQARHQREIERGVLSFDHDVAGQPAEAELAQIGPQQADHEDHEAEQDQEAHHAGGPFPADVVVSLHLIKDARQSAMSYVKFNTALIVGAGSGLSAALARVLAKEGIKVALAARTPADLDGLAKEIGASTFACDASKRTDVEKLFADLDASFGAPEIVIYNPS